MKIIEIVVQWDGSIRLETKGFAGSSCQAASRFLESALGSCISEQLTSEYFASHYQPQEQRE